VWRSRLATLFDFRHPVRLFARLHMVCGSDLSIRSGKQSRTSHMSGTRTKLARAQFQVSPWAYLVFRLICKYRCSTFESYQTQSSSIIRDCSSGILPTDAKPTSAVIRVLTIVVMLRSFREAPGGAQPPPQENFQFRCLGKLASKAPTRRCTSSGAQLDAVITVKLRKWRSIPLCYGA
jgi:hypothetical protein